MLSLIDAVLLLVLAGNLLAFGLFWLDKRRAETGAWRISESTLLLAAAFGGLGGWMGQHLLRHKTRKEPFRTRLGVIASLYAVIMVGAAVVFILRQAPAYGRLPLGTIGLS